MRKWTGRILLVVAGLFLLAHFFIPLGRDEGEKAGISRRGERREQRVTDIGATSVTPHSQRGDGQTESAPSSESKAPLQRKTFVIRGTVKQGPFAHIVANARVEIAQHQYYRATGTNERGEFEIRDIPQGATSILASLHENSNVSKGMILHPLNDEEIVEIVLPPGASVTVAVVDQAGRPVTGARVEYYHWDNNVMEISSGKMTFREIIGESDELGLARFDGVRLCSEGGTVPWISAAHPGYVSAVVDNLRIIDGENLFKLVLAPLREPEPSGWIQGQIVAPDGTPLRNLTFWRFSRKATGSTYTSETRTDGDGRFSSEVFSRGLGVKNQVVQAEISIRIWHEGYKPVNRVVASALKSGETMDIGVIRMEPGYILTGSVYDNDGQPIGGAKISIEQAQYEGRFDNRSFTVTTDQRGYFETRSLGDDLYFIYAEKEGYFPMPEDDIDNYLKKNVPPNTYNLEFKLRKHEEQEHPRDDEN